VIARGTSFVTEVNTSGATRVITIEGIVSVSANESEVSLTKDQQVLVAPGRIPDEPQPVVSELSELVVSTDSSAVISIRDPSGASTGYFPSGVSFYQIKGSKTWLTENGQKIQIIEPQTGKYQLIVRKISREDVTLSIQAISGEDALSSLREVISGSGKGWIIHLILEKNISGTSVSVQAVESLEEKKPENVVVPEIAEKEAVAITQRPVTLTDTVSPSLEPSNTEINNTPSNTTSSEKPIDSAVRPDDTNTQDANLVPSNNETEPSLSTTNTNPTTPELDITDEPVVDSEQDPDGDDANNPPVDIDVTATDDTGSIRDPDNNTDVTR
jgi:hypothetical protein